MPFCPHLILKINFTIDRSSVECTKFLIFRDQTAIQDRYHVSQALFLVTLKFQPWDQNLVFCAIQPQSHWFHIMALENTGILFFYERSPTLHIQAKGVGGGKKREGAKSLVSKTTD